MTHDSSLHVAQLDPLSSLLLVQPLLSIRNHNIFNQDHDQLSHDVNTVELWNSLNYQLFGFEKQPKHAAHLVPSTAIADCSIQVSKEPCGELSMIYFETKHICNV